MSKLALLGGEAVLTGKSQAPWPRISDNDKQRLLEVLDSKGWGGFPEPMPMAKQFADKFAKAHDAKYGVCATNGSVTLEVALNALGVEAGDEVIVPTYTWIATGAAPIHMNAVPVFVDIDPDTYCLDCDQVEAAITDRTKGIIPVHLGSTIADLDRLKEITNKHNLWMIEDCAHAHGAKWNGQGVGSFGEVGSFSFQSSKLMTSGEGGAVITSDDDLAQRLHSIINCGRKEPGYDSFEGWHLGYNARITEFQAAMLLGQLEQLDGLTKIRSKAAEYLEKNLSELGIGLLKRDKRITTRTNYELIVKFDSQAFSGISRDRFLEALSAEGFDIDGDFYVPMHENPLFNAQTKHFPMLKERYGDGIQSPATVEKLNFPQASKAAYEEAIWIHQGYLLGGEDMLRGIVDAVEKIKRYAGEL